MIGMVPFVSTPAWITGASDMPPKAVRLGEESPSSSGLHGGRTPADPLREPSGAVADAAMRQRALDVIKHARTRWLRNTEVCDVLLNYNAYGFEPENNAPVRPGAGTMFLINRKTVRFFRKDGHNWQKKKDGKTVRETHEKLKVGTVELLNCYYTHCDDDPRFQRRCYWLLNMD